MINNVRSVSRFGIFLTLICTLILSGCWNEATKMDEKMMDKPEVKMEDKKDEDAEQGDTKEELEEEENDAPTEEEKKDEEAPAEKVEEEPTPTPVEVKEEPTPAPVEVKEDPVPPPAEVKAPTPAPQQVVKNITLTAKRWEYSPSTIRAKEGDKIVITINNTDTTHGIAIPDLGISGNNVVTIENAKKGTYTFMCANFCGQGHSEMKGTLIVD